MKMGRREFIGVSTGATVSLAMGAAAGADPARETVRIGVIGTGGRGSGLLGLLLTMPGIEVPAVCDINLDAANAAKGMVTTAGKPEPEAYTEGDYAYKGLVEREDLDAVIIATPWNWHTPMAVDAMKCGKYAGIEVPCAITMDECWDLVDTSEKTGVPCMMLENWSFRRDNLAVLNMIRAGLLGQIVHCHCAHSHMCIDHWFFDPQGNIRWGGEFLVKYNRDQYPTHSLGPVISWLDINCGDQYDRLTSTATDSTAINAYFARKFGPDHPNATRKYAQGDIVTTTIRTHRGRTIVVNYDMQLPRPYDNRWMVQGTLGIYSENHNSVYLVDRSPQYDTYEPFPPYQEEFDHAWCREATASGDTGHGGTDYLELALFVKAVREGTQTPIDVYDSVSMSCIVPLSEKSIKHGSEPVDCPDFTRGRWKERAPRFAVDPSYPVRPVTVA